MSDTFISKLKALTGGYFSLSPYLVPQSDAESSIREGVSFKGTNIIILIFAIFIASLGLNTNSTAVIIGAMLISPLMGPIIGIGLGIGIADFSLLKRSLRNLVIAAIFSVLAAAFYFLISPVAEGHSELLARTQPTIYDVLIAFFGGGAGIVAICSVNKGNVIPGVAIATALMPPLCTAGYGLATLQMHYFLGASYLFLINSIYICIATFIGVKVFKFRPVTTPDPKRSRRIQKIVYAVAIVTLLPSVYMTYTMIRTNRFALNVDKFVSQECQWPDTHVLSTTKSWNKEGKQIGLTLIGRPMKKDSLILALSSKLRFYGLEGAKIKIFQGDAPVSTDQLREASASDVYQITQSALKQKQAEVDSLSGLLASDRAVMRAASDILPELHVVFPKLRDIAITKAVFADPYNNRLDTVEVALVAAVPKFNARERYELKRYLEARLRIDTIRLVEVAISVP